MDGSTGNMPGLKTFLQSHRTGMFLLVMMIVMMRELVSGLGFMQVISGSSIRPEVISFTKPSPTRCEYQRFFFM